MARFSAALALLAVLASQAAAFPINPRTLAERALAKRIAQTTIDAPKKWEDACTAAGGADKCNPIAVTAAATLLAAAGPCDQQDSGDAMVDLAKQLNNDQAMITAAQIFIQQPRNSPNSVATVYCQTAPKNDELAGFFQCQFQGADQTKFSNGQAAGGDGTVPLGLTSLSPPGSCPANPSGPIADGTQLSDTATSPSTPSSGSGSGSSSGSASSGNSTATATSATSGASSTATTGDDSGDDSDDDEGCGDGTSTVTVASATAAATATGVATSAAAVTTAVATGTATASAAASTSTNFVLANGLDAQKQNLDSLSIKATDSCTDGSFACVQGEIMQCANSAYVSMGNCTASAAANTSCFFLPFVAKASVSAPACVSADVAESRIANSGATGGIFGNGAKAQGTVPLSA